MKQEDFFLLSKNLYKRKGTTSSISFFNEMEFIQCAYSFQSLLEIESNF